MFRFQLYCPQGTPTTVIITPETSNEDDTVLYCHKAPIDWDKMSYNFSRDEFFIGLISEYSGQLGWVAQAREWLNNLYLTVGSNVEISIQITCFDRTVHKFVYFINGVLNLSNYSIQQTRSDCNFEQSKFFQAFRNFGEVNLDVRQTFSLATNTEYPHGIPITPIAPVDLFININSECQTTCKAFRPYDLFKSLIKIMIGADIAIRSPLLQIEGVDGATDTGDLAYKMITLGKMIRGFNNATLSLSLKTLFKCFKIFCVGLSIEQDTDTGEYFIYIDKIEKFFDRNIVHEITNPKNLEFTIDTDHSFKTIDIGFNKYQKPQNNSISGREFNLKNNYTTPLSSIDSSLDVTSDIRADGTAIKLLIDAKVSVEDNSENQLDGEIFIIDSFIDLNNDNILTARKDELFTTVIDDSTSAAPEVMLNIDLTPARLLKTTGWGSIIHSGLKKYNSQYLRLNPGETLSQLRTRRNNETADISENAAVLISTLGWPYFSGQMALLNFTLEIEDILAIKRNPRGIIKIYDNIHRKNIYCWVKEAPSEPIDKATNGQFYVCSEDVVETAVKSKIKTINNDGYIKNMSGGYIFSINEN